MTGYCHVAFNCREAHKSEVRGACETAAISFLTISASEYPLGKIRIIVC